MHALNVLGFQPFVADDDIEGDIVALIQGFESRADNGRMMHKHVLPGILGDEPKPFFIIEPLDFATGHNLLLTSRGATLKAKRTRLKSSRACNHFSETLMPN